ncbi:MAG: lysylphosphatidylglycerol synthase transmembrane domain-containing protein [Proteiniphilum sp.]|nr:lysylphosphatidylglycerol synthase transmembrane domain-containing protein [Proteiniphilum sp.]NCB26280.1 flippase-like domain-containing protein [Bacteroidia bacterium]MDD2936923.1 lysylphosphatidylglycerol synthase transmembrane domain-containing protein [Proteiniphilum sp.]MDD3076574.1 lysylphosphatidylglycerol synthase transmembrane domain-containing protein [Proteiniphilum sp.]MDD3779176.1 lysylphosphatidylglycerol synthase transmembrane domain-containing protein [Proteiniphilum sp.]
MKISAESVKSALKTVLSLLLGLLIIWMMYRNTDLGELWQIAKSGNLVIIGISLIFGLLGNILRGLRWELFVNSLGYRPPRASIVYATLGNYAVNFVLPRAGDVWRCGVVSKYDKIPFGKTVETFLVDKVIDVLAGLLVIFVSVALYIDFFISYFHDNPQFAENMSDFFSSAWIRLLLVALLLVVILLLTVFRKKPFMVKISKLLYTVKYDLKMIGKMKEKWRIIIYTILIWFCFYLYFYICFFAFDFTKELGPLAGLIVFAMTNIGISVPVQGGIGPWHFMVISSLVVLGVAENQALAFAGAVFTIQSVWQILYGLFGVFTLPYVKRENGKLATVKII